MVKYELILFIFERMTMSAKIIALLQQKGGAQKTTTAVNLTGALLELKYRVLLCDMDKAKPDAVYWSDLGGRELSPYVTELFDENPLPRITQFKSNHDYILLDCPPNFEAAALKAAMMCDLAIIPCSSSELDKHALINAASAASLANKPYYFLASRVFKNTLSSKSLKKELLETGKSFQSEISNSVDIIECQKYGQWVGAYKPNCTSHDQYMNLAKELISLLGSK